MISRTSYPVLCSVVLFLALLAGARKLFVSYVPPVATNRLATSKVRFLFSGGHFAIAWHVLDDNPFPAAMRAHKPILLVIGTAGSHLATQMDLAAFGDQDTDRFVSQNFYCIRVDGFKHPEWLAAILPVSRLKSGLFPEFQACALDLNGKLVSLIACTSANHQFDPTSLYRELLQARDQFDDEGYALPTEQPRQDLQSLDFDSVDRPAGSAAPELRHYTASVASQCDLNIGGFPKGEMQQLYPNVWRYLTYTGDEYLWKVTLDPLLCSRLLDLQDGGFFRLSTKLDISHVGFEKGTANNAEMMLALALQGQVDSDPFYQALSKSTFDWLIGQARANGALSACQLDDENSQGRSPRLSFPTWRLRENLDGADRDWAAENLGLDPMNNAQMTPYPRSRVLFAGHHPTLDRVLTVLRESTTVGPDFNDPGYLDVNGHSLACMLESVRLWGDGHRLNILQPLLRKLAAFRNEGGELFHSANGTAAYLGDYLAYADAQLQAYLAFGDVRRLQDGKLVLDAAVKKFQGKQVGRFNLCNDADRMGGFDHLCVPQLADDIDESCTGQMIRLLLGYGRLFADKPVGKSYLRIAHASVGLFSSLERSGGTSSAGFFCAAAEVADGTYSIAVGPDAVDLADRLYRRVPVRFSAPALGGVRSDLQSRGAGIYIIGKSVEGPFTVEQAAERLPAVLNTRTRRVR